MYSNRCQIVLNLLQSDFDFSSNLEKSRWERLLIRETGLSMREVALFYKEIKRGEVLYNEDSLYLS